jgi:sugar phosphate isomerase/epimerase
MTMITYPKSGLSRREFLATSAVGAPALLARPRSTGAQTKLLRLGGPVMEKYSDPGEWASLARSLGYSAASFQIGTFYDKVINDDLIRAYAQAAAKANITISEISAFSNTFQNDEARKKAIQMWSVALDVADRIGARCITSTAGERALRTDPGGPPASNLSDETFNMIVENTRMVIDAVKPKNTYFTWSPMPWILPNSPDSFLRLLKAVDRKQFGVHMDPTNMINGIDRYYNNGEFLRECFRKLGPYIRSCHVKDVLLMTDLPIRITELQPGLGRLDLRTYLTEASKFPDNPLMLEHLKTQEEYAGAARYLRSVAGQIGLAFI